MEGSEVKMFIVGFVNYKSSIYMETQLKIYREFAGEEFQIVIIDNSMNEKEFEVLQEMASHFSIPIEVVLFSPPSKRGSAAHGEGLQYIYELRCQNEPNIQYFLTQDPDFFWVKPQFLTYLKFKLQTYTVVGAPYHPHYVEWSGHPNFPAAFGAAYRIKDLQRVKADFRYSPQSSPNGHIRDVGWIVRERLADQPYFYFEQETCQLTEEHSFEKGSRKYIDNGTVISYHLIRGCHETSERKGRSMAKSSVARQELLKTLMPPKKWQDNRRRACEFFWKKINDAANKETI